MFRLLTCTIVPLGSVRYWPDHLRVPVPDCLRPVVLCLLVLCAWTQHFAILRWQRFLCNRKLLLPGYRRKRQLIYLITGDVRVPLHSYRTSHRSVCAQRRLRSARQPTGDRDACIFRRRGCALQPDPGFLEILVSSRANPIQPIPQLT